MRFYGYFTTENDRAKNMWNDPKNMRSGDHFTHTERKFSIFHYENVPRQDDGVAPAVGVDAVTVGRFVNLPSISATASKMRFYGYLQQRMIVLKTRGMTKKTICVPGIISHTPNANFPHFTTKTFLVKTTGWLLLLVLVLMLWQGQWRDSSIFQVFQPMP